MRNFIGVILVLGLSTILCSCKVVNARVGVKTQGVLQNF